MALQDSANVLTRIAEVAALAGLKGKVGEDNQTFGMMFRLGENRTQLVQVRHVGRSPDDKDVVMFFSPARRIAKGLLKGVSRDTALDLLMRNGQLMFARFGIIEFDHEYLVVASTDQLLETLDPDEFRHTALSVAAAADQYEQQHADDEF